MTKQPEDLQFIDHFIEELDFCLTLRYVSDDEKDGRTEALKSVWKWAKKEGKTDE